MTLQDFGIIAGIMLAVCGPLVGMLWVALNGRLGRLERSLDALWNKMVSVDVCEAREKRTNDVADGMSQRMDRLETRLGT